MLKKRMCNCWTNVQAATDKTYTGTNYRIGRGKVNSPSNYFTKKSQVEMANILNYVDSRTLKPYPYVTTATVLEKRLKLFTEMKMIQLYRYVVKLKELWSLMWWSLTSAEQNKLRNKNLNIYRYSLHLILSENSITMRKERLVPMPNLFKRITSA
jgi:hypothetical protein